ncbi:MAG: family 78 glycoside hydrolase catalytic domain [Clostridia bacterium]|nr:family 78 glycoside hydrolase catalytic domain [Clostridia bacterium]
MELNFITTPNTFPHKSPLRVVPEEVRNLVCGRPIYFRRTFTIEKPGEAVIHFCSLGYNEVFLDGKKIGDTFLSPGWTDFNKRIYYDTYVLSLSKGIHTLSAIVADGWYAGNMGNYGPGQFDDIVAFAARITFSDGTILDTDTDWRISNGGYLYADLFYGEAYDANQEPEGWKFSNFDDSDWEEARVALGYANGTQFLPRKCPPIREKMTLIPAKCERDSKGNYIYDMGQNMTGVLRVRFDAKKGVPLVLRHAEVLDDTDLYTDNLRGARQTDTFIPASDGLTEYSPCFTFHGFRYVESNLELSDIEGVVLYSDIEQTGNIETSSPLVNKLFQNQLWGQRCNFLDVPTDCPQRNERLGWAGDAQVFARTAMYNMDSDVFYEKYMIDVRDAALPDGSMAEIAPRVYVTRGRTMFSRPSPGWGEVIFIIPYHHWKMYGKTDILRDNYGHMKRFFSYLESKATGFLQPDFGNGDWLNVDCVTPKDVFATLYFAYDALLLSEIANVLGQKEDAAYYRTAYAAIRNAFLTAYTGTNGVIKGDTQCAYAMALLAGLYTDKACTAAHLARTVNERDNHLSTGFFGTSYLLPMLCETGYTELAYTILLQKTYPSWGYCIKMGATTMWERWNGYTDTDGFFDPSMNSFNHYSFGSVGQWMYEFMGGIRPLSPGFSRFAVVPHMDSRVPKVTVSYKSVKGLIRVEYNTKEGVLLLTVPADTIAEVILDGETHTLYAGQHTLSFCPLTV